MPAPKAKNRRYRNSKLSEHRLRRVVECFASDMTAAETVKATRLSAPTVNLIFHRLRERMRDHGLFVPQFGDEPHPLAEVFNAKHRGLPKRLHDLYAIERIHRVLCAQHLKGFERLPASDPASIEKAIRLLRFDAKQPARRYLIWEAFRRAEGDTGAPETRPFDARHIGKDSDILINELHASPEEAFFAYIWCLLLRHPL